MTNGELRRKVQEANGKLEISDRVKVQHRENELTLYFNGEYAGWLYHNKAENGNVHDDISIASAEALLQPVPLFQFAQYIGIDTGELTPITIEKVHIEKSGEESILKGKVEAYEKLLLGRGVSISK